MALSLDWRALGRGSAAYVAVAAPSVLVISLLPDTGTLNHEPNLWITAAALVIFVAPITGGAVAGAAQPHTPLTHAALAVGGPVGLFLLVRAIVRGALGTLTASSVLTSLLYLGVFTSFAIVGGYVAFRRQNGAR